MLTKAEQRNRSMRRGSLSAPILRVILLALIPAFLMAAQPAHAQSKVDNGQKIGEGVAEMIHADGEARVVIALTEPQVGIERRAGLSMTMAQVYTVQEVALASVDETDFALSHQYQTVPALAGTLYTQSALNQLAANPVVVKIDLDVGAGATLGSSVPHIGANTWASSGIDGSGVTVAVLDSGIDTDNSDLASALVHEACFLDNDGSINGSGLCPNGSDRQDGAGAAEDGYGHGTHVSGIVGSRGNVSSAGVAPGVNIEAIKVLDNNGNAHFLSEIVAALDYIAANRDNVQVINMSLGTFIEFEGECDTTTAYNIALANAVNNLRGKGVTSIAASGNNSSSTTMGSPACLKNVISVGATDLSDNVAGFSNSNSVTDIMAPGVAILSSGIGDTAVTDSGTSMASPHAAGCAALLIASGEATTPAAIETRLKTSSIQVTDPKNNLTFPRIDCTVGVRIDVAKQLDPTDDPGIFALSVITPSGGIANVAPSATHGSTGTYYGGPGAYSVAETSVGDTDLAGYTSHIFCREDGGEGQVIFEDVATVASLGTLAAEDHIVCTFTNVRKTADLIIRK